MIPADLGWSDLGTWTSVYENAEKMRTIMQLNLSMFLPIILKETSSDLEIIIKQYYRRFRKLYRGRYRESSDLPN